MTIGDFERAARLTGSGPYSDTMRACRMSVTNGISLHEAAHYYGITHPTVYRKMKQLRAALALPVCESCGRPKAEQPPKI